MHEPLEEFAAHLTDYERLAPTTVANWVKGAASLLASVDDCDAAARGEISVAEFRAWMLSAEERGLSSSTRQNLWYAARAYYRWLEHDGYQGSSPLQHVRPPRARHAARRDYSREEAEAILVAARAAADVGTWRDVYDYTLISTLRFTGARQAEIATARSADLDLRRRQLSVVGKGSKLRSIPLPRSLVADLDRYLSEVRPILPDSAWLFPTRTRRSGGRPQVISGAWIWKVCRRFGEAAGVAGPHHPHRWRHTYATHLLRAGVDVVVVRDLLGHSSVMTTSIYLHLLRDDLRDGVDRGFST